MNHWLAIGPNVNWAIGIKKKAWAVGLSYSKNWGKVESEDTVFFYATAPVEGLVGYGIVCQVSVDEGITWPQEKEVGHVLWPFRIRFKEVHHIAYGEWETHRVVLDRKGITLQRSFQPVDNRRAREWSRKLRKAISL